MRRKERKYDDDDGRTVADMSNVERPNNFSIVPRLEHKTAGEEAAEREARRNNPDKLWENNDVTGDVRRSYIFGALGAALAIAAVFAVGIGLAILIMVLVWK